MPEAGATDPAAPTEAGADAGPQLGAAVPISAKRGRQDEKEPQMSQLTESSSSTATLPKPDAAPASPPLRLPPKRPRSPRRTHERGAEVAIDKEDRSPAEVAETQEQSHADRPRHLPLLRADEAGLSNQERRCRLEALALRLAETPEFTSRLRLYERHTLRELSSAAALRPELMPTLNGEFEHLAFFAP